MNNFSLLFTIFDYIFYAQLFTNLICALIAFSSLFCIQNFEVNETDTSSLLFW